MGQEPSLSESEGRVLSRMNILSKRDDVTVEWRKLHIEVLNDLYCSPNLTQVMKSRRMRWAGRVELWGEERSIQTFGRETSGK
jgi:hypothetical protein